MAALRAHTPHGGSSVALVEADVIGPFPIVDATGGGDKVRGQTVVLDDAVTNVDALLGVHVANVRPYVKPARKTGGAA